MSSLSTKIFSFWVLFGALSLMNAQDYSKIETEVLEGMRSTDWQVRLYSANILGQIRCKAAITEIKGRLFKESNRLVMAEYCKTLGLVGDPIGIDILLELLNAEKTDILNGQPPLDQLGKKQREEAEAKLKIERAEFEILYTNAIWALGRLKAKKGVKTLCSWVIMSNSKQIRDMAIQSLIEIHEFETIDFLTRALGKAGGNKLTPEEIEYRKNAFEALIQLLPKFKQAEQSTAVGTEEGGSRILNTTVQNANFIFTQTFRLPKSFGRLVNVVPSGEDTYLWFEGEQGVIRVLMDVEGNFNMNALKMGRFEETPPEPAKK